ncbi:hypothetical protein POM88_001316 [Heracleum sosnowskyi]|uniref:Uncharacterized protein n=1 Tax=Heracleum sosnowskyi TaxID=360622 RepID=A0AAD8JFL3_9APIA|nr:hypothetical protein POM88_001316 [Heracleum sosnowskyi]
MEELEEYMDYDDWNLVQKLMINGCDPLPRRRCLTRASKLYNKPNPTNESLWRLHIGGNIRWSNYQCRNFGFLSSKNPKRDVLAIKPAEIWIGLDFGVGSGHRNICCSGHLLMK